MNDTINNIWNGSVQSCENRVQQAFEAGLNYSDGLDTRYKIVIIAMLSISILLFAFLEKKLKNAKKGKTNSEDYYKILKAVHQLVVFLLVGIVFITFYVFGLW